jgi:hypothetical protein
VFPSSADIRPTSEKCQKLSFPALLRIYCLIKSDHVSASIDAVEGCGFDGTAETGHEGLETRDALESGGIGLMGIGLDAEFTQCIGRCLDPVA